MPKRTPASPTSGSNASRRIGDTTVNCPLGGRWPAAPPARHEEYSLEEYKAMWEADHCRTMTESEVRTLRAGCIGITALNLGINRNPPLDNCYSTLDQAKARAKQMTSTCAASGMKPQLFSKRFYSDGKDYTADPATGKVDMSGYSYKAKPGFTNFDYGWYDERSDSWFHANHGDFPQNPMRVYRSTLEYYSRPLLDFDKQVFGVSCGP